MAKRQSSRGASAVNPTISVHDILGFAEAGLAVETRAEIGAVELVIRERGRITETLVLAPRQAARLAERLLLAALPLAAAEVRS